MRKTSIIIISVILLLGYYSCKPANRKEEITGSRMEYFRYGGHTDTVYAHISGEVYEVDSDNHLHPLQDVTVKIEQIDKVTQTNKIGIFGFWLEKGVFDILITKYGYESIKLKNYVSDPDQLSSTKIILMKGEGIQTVEIPAWKEK